MAAEHVFYGENTNGVGGDVQSATAQAALMVGASAMALPFTVPKQLLKGIFVNRRGQRFVNEDAYQTVVGERALLGEGGEVFLVVPPIEFLETLGVRGM